MAPGSKWYPLPEFPNTPALMISPCFGSTSYTLHLTDFANVWVESLDRKRIVHRSIEEDISIDLCDGDPNQWAVFLSKLHAAFDPSSLDYHSTSLGISADSSGRTADGGLVLYATCVLPKPLKPLKWPMHFTKCPPVGVASELVLPLIQAHHERTLEIHDLVERLKDKDAVITKLVDKLEANKIGLEHVFTSLSGKRRPTRAVAEDKINGLAMFDESDWRSSLRTTQELPQDLPSLIHEAFVETGLHCSVDAKITPSDELNDWWAKLGSRPSVPVRPRTETPQELHNSPPPSDTKATGQRDDEDFQAQIGIPNLQSRGGKHDYIVDTTDDGDNTVEVSSIHPAPSREKARSRIGAVGGRRRVNDENSPSQSSRTVHADDDETPSESDAEPVQPRTQTQGIPRLGNIGKSKEPSPPAQASSPPHVSSHGDDETASDTDHEDSDRSPKTNFPSPPSVPTRREKGGLGRIGGKPKSRATPEPFDHSGTSVPGSESPKAPASPAKLTGRKIGTIGKAPTTDGKRQRSKSPANAAEPETEEQRSERRRAELAKELEHQASAPTKKKKRKF
ncbi:XLF-domain-containing protein [Hypomontagnella submonticulosa]|nr:XLF-domain-containing protein [Hypomontagnella submonticulosa]